MELYTKDDLKMELENGKSLDQMLYFRSGQDCQIFKADDFYLGDVVIYIPDIDLNGIDIEETDLDEEYIRDILRECFTGNDFVELCGGDIKQAERVFWYCDWQHPSSAYEDLMIQDEEEFV